uniref:Conotoxin n=1 Tax=Conus quercinus TaxID=101313 RepID=S4UKA4_CONQU|nr:T superfamily conotoxin Qc5.3 precursor [Conus quercinus]
MLCLPVFIILLLLVSPAATLRVQSKLERFLTQQSPRDFAKKVMQLRYYNWIDCCFDGDCCN